MHYGAAYSALVDTLPDVAAVVPEFPSAIAFLLESALSKVGGKAGAVMDIGCGVGGVAFKLAESFNRVVAIDRDADALGIAQTLQSTGSATIRLTSAAVSSASASDTDRIAGSALCPLGFAGYRAESLQTRTKLHPNPLGSTRYIHWESSCTAVDSAVSASGRRSFKPSDDREQLEPLSLPYLIQMVDT